MCRFSIDQFFDVVLLNLAGFDVAVDGLKNHPDMGAHFRLLSAGEARYFWLRAFG